MQSLAKPTVHSPNFSLTSTPYEHGRKNNLKYEVSFLQKQKTKDSSVMLQVTFGSWRYPPGLSCCDVTGFKAEPDNITLPVF